MSNKNPIFPAGWKIFPCHPNSKKPIHDGWPELATDNIEVVNKWALDYPGCNWAVACGPSGLAVLDPDGEVGATSLFDFQLENGFLPETRVHKTPRGGEHYIFSGAITNSVGKLGPKLDTRGGNGYIVIPPSTFEDKPYELQNDRPVALLPEFVGAALARAREHIGASADVSLDTGTAISRATELLRGYVRRGHIAIEGRGGDERTYAVAAEVLNLGLSKETAFELLNDIWNVACVPPWDADELAIKIENASQYSQNDAGAWAVPSVTERIDKDALDKLLADSDMDANVSNPTQGGDARFPWMDEAAFTTMAEPVWLLPEIFTTESIAMLYGPSGHYKSFLALNLGAAVAQQDLCAFYVAAEGISRMARKDFPAWKLAYGEERRIPFFMQEEMPQAIDDQDYEAFAKSIDAIARREGKKVGIIFLDTLNTALLGLDENSSGDTAKLMQRMKYLKKAFKCCVVAIHHTPDKDQGKARGSSALYAGMDTVLHVIAEKDVKLVRMHVTKQKTAEEREYPFCFEGKKVGTGLAFMPVDNKAARELSADADIYNPKNIGKVLASMKAYDPGHVTSHVLAEAITPQIINETVEDRNDSVARVKKALAAAAKSGKLDGYAYGRGAGIKWMLPAHAD